MTSNQLVHQVEDFFREDFVKVKELKIYGNPADVAKAEQMLNKSVIGGYEITCSLFAEIDNNNFANGIPNKRYGLRVQFDKL